MSEPPEIRITGGAPSEAEERAAREAILAIWRADVADAVRASGVSPWVAAARAEATRRGAGALRGRAGGAWRWSGRLDEPVSNLQPGRGDAR